MTCTHIYKHTKTIFKEHFISHVFTKCCRVLEKITQKKFKIFCYELRLISCKCIYLNYSLHCSIFIPDVLCNNYIFSGLGTTTPLSHLPISCKRSISSWDTFPAHTLRREGGKESAASLFLF